MCDTEQVTHTTLYRGGVLTESAAWAARSQFPQRAITDKLHSECRIHCVRRGLKGNLQHTCAGINQHPFPPTALLSADRKQRKQCDANGH